MHGPINVKYPNNISKWQMEFNSAFKGLISLIRGRNLGGHIFKNAYDNPQHRMESQFRDFGSEICMTGKILTARRRLRYKKIDSAD
jgi:hypothetical protein